jgi:uncharacterized protein YndB with AHSA1/START domain
MSQTVSMPDLSERPFACYREKVFKFNRALLYHAWTEGLDTWFAAKGSMLMKSEINAPFYFETAYKPEGKDVETRHPHYGRILNLISNQLVEMTWVTGAGGTEGAETVVRVELHDVEGDVLLRITHAGFKDENSKGIHHLAWGFVLDKLEDELKKKYSRLN